MSPALPGPGDRPGSVPPRRRLPVTPAALARVKARLPRAPSRFPLAPPTWPDSLTPPPERPTLGSAYDTAWARRYPARFARVLLTELITRPAVVALARPSIEGDDRLAHLREPVIFAANHASHVDTPLLLSVLPEQWRHRTVVAAGADYFFDNRVKAAVSALTINAIPIERLKVSRDSVNRASALLAEGWSLLIFPEGGRSPDGWGQSHTAGAAWLAVRTGRAVVPVHLDGTRDILPRGSSRLRPGTTRVTFGRPIRPVAGTDARELSGRIERSIAALSDERTTDWYTARVRAAQQGSPDLTGPPVAPWRRNWALGADGGKQRSAKVQRWPKQ
jgi:1-acyl-sn-glycerol-3-phosphate acyltransferase